MNDNELNSQTAMMTEETVLCWLEAHVNQLYAEANALADDYWRQFKSERKNHPTSAQGRIGVRIRRREACLSFSIEWFKMSTLRENGQHKPIAQYLKKGPGYRYPLTRILKDEPDWERALVEEMENDFADIRKQMDLLGKIRDALQNYRKATQKLSTDFVSL
jgi:hypothetical protein